MTVLPDPMGPELRKARLAQAVQVEVATGGRVESQTDINAIIRHGKSTNHVLHVLLSIFTLGIWLCIWPIVGIVNILSRKPTMSLSVDEYGNILRQRLQ